MDIVQIINWASIGLFALVAIIGFVRGIFKGTFRSLADIGFVLVNAIASIFIAKGIANLLISPERVYGWMITLNERLESEAIANAITSLEPYLAEGELLTTVDLSQAMALPIAIVTPILFLIVFFVLGIIIKIVKTIIQKLLIPKTPGAPLRILGGALGAVRSVLAIAVLLVPIVGFATYGVNTVHIADDAMENNDGIGEIAEQVYEYEGAVTGGGFGAVSTCGGQWLFNILSTTGVDGIDVSLTDETESFVNIYVAGEKLIDADFTNLTKEDSKNISALIDKVEESEYLTSLISFVVSTASSELHNNGELVGFELPYYGKSLDPVVHTLLEIFSTTDKDGFVKDLRTLSTLVDHTVDYGLFAQLSQEDGDIFVVLENGDFYSDVLITLYNNERTRPILPTLVDGLQSFMYEVYENVNGKPYGNGEIVKIDASQITALSMTEEGQRIATAIKEIRHFASTVDTSGYVDEIVKTGDFAALGRALNQLRDSIFFGNSYRFLLDTLLKSETCVKVGIFDKNFVDNATKPNADMENLLLSRQSLTQLTIAMWEGDREAQEEALKVLLEQVSPDDVDALKELVTPENLKRYGVKGDKGQTISDIATYVADTIHNHAYEDTNGDGSIEDEKHAEVESAAHVITVINGVHSNTHIENVFENGTDESRTGETAEGLVDSILSSPIATEMIASATSNSGTDPLNVEHMLSQSDKESLESVLTDKLATATTVEESQNIYNAALLFGIELP